MENDSVTFERAERFKAFFERHIQNSMRAVAMGIEDRIKEHWNRHNIGFHLMAGERCQNKTLWNCSLGSVPEDMNPKLLDHLRTATEKQRLAGHGFTGIGDYNITINNPPTETPDFQPDFEAPLFLIMADCMPDFIGRLNSFLSSKEGATVDFHLFFYELESEQKARICEGIATNLNPADVLQLLAESKPTRENRVNIN